ncbi:MAG: DUF5819 family protein [Crocinitomicaceae bacterium]|nr:DUF5819 family protein [Crocinitomicaceae bacterium]
MEEKRKIRLGWAGFAFIVFHFGVIFLYAMPDQWKNETVEEVTGSYVNPIFYQKWNLFAPCPLIDGSLSINFKFESGEETGWINPGMEILKTHRWLRFTHHGKIVLGEANLIYFLYRDLYYEGHLDSGEDVSFEKFPSYSDGYRKLKTYSLGYGEYLFDEEVISCDTRVRFTNVKNGNSVNVEFVNIEQWKH